MLPLVSITLLTYNAEKYLRKCLGSVLEQNYPSLEIIIIDNNSKDGTRDFLKDLEKNFSGFDEQIKLRVIFSDKNLGFAAGHNLGIKESKGDFILCLNQDVVLDSNFISQAIEMFEKDKKTGAIQGKLLRWHLGHSTNKLSGYQVAHIIDTTGLVILKNRRIINQGQGEIDQGQFEEIEEIFGADGATPIYRRQALEDIKIGDEYFDEDFFCYKEDVDLAWRLRLYGWKTFYQPSMIGWHARTAGDSAAKSYLSIIKERLSIGKFAKYLAFKNQRLMQLKNEQFQLLLKHSPWFLSKEIASWIFVIIFERYTWRAIRDLFKQMPNAWRKRKIIMARKRAGTSEVGKWFR